MHEADDDFSTATTSVVLHVYDLATVFKDHVALRGQPNVCFNCFLMPL
jgi:hypothetical protein